MTSADFIFFFFFFDLNEGLLETNGKMSGCFTLRRETHRKKKRKIERGSYTVSFSSFFSTFSSENETITFNTQRWKKGRERKRERERDDDKSNVSIASSTYQDCRSTYGRSWYVETRSIYTNKNETENVATSSAQNKRILSTNFPRL